MITVTLPGRIIGKGRPRATVIRPNKDRDAARESWLASIAEPVDLKAALIGVWDAGWKAASEIGFISEYTPKETREAEARIKTYGVAAMCGRQALDGPVWLSIEIRQTPPASWPMRKREQTRYITGKPDGDNQLKLIMDALRGTCWRDDSVIAAFAFGRFYDLEGPEQAIVRFGVLDAARMPVPEWAPKVLPLFEGVFA